MSPSESTSRFHLGAHAESMVGILHAFRRRSDGVVCRHWLLRDGQFPVLAWRRAAVESANGASARCEECGLSKVCVGGHQHSRAQQAAMLKPSAPTTLVNLS